MINVVATNIYDAKYKIKASDESLSSSTTLQDDNELLYTFPGGNKKYEVIAMISPSSTLTSSADFKCDWSISSDLTVDSRWCLGSGNSSTSIINSETLQVRKCDYSDVINYNITAGFGHAIREKLIIDTGATGGTLTFRWAQENSSASSIKVQAGSYLRIARIKEV